MSLTGYKNQLRLKRAFVAGVEFVLEDNDTLAQIPAADKRMVDSLGGGIGRITREIAQ